MSIVTPLEVSAQITMVYDTFTGTDATSLAAHTPDTNLPLSNWTIRSNGTIVLNGNAALSTQGDGYSWPSWAAIESNTCDGTIAVDWTPGTGLPYGPRAGLIVRMSDSLNYWFAGYGVQGTTLGLWKVVNGSWGLVTSASVSSPLGTTHHLEVRLDDSSIQVWYDGAQKIQWIDAFNAWSTMHGVEWDVNTDWASKFDNFTVQTPSYQTVSSVVVTPAGSLTGAGAAQFLTATALNAQGQAIPDALFHWTLSDATHGTLSTTGHYAAAAAILMLTGDVTISAEMLGGPSGSAAITVDASRTMVADQFTGTNGTNLTAHTPTLNAAQAAWSVHATQAMTLQAGQVQSAQTDCPYPPVAYLNASTSDGVVSADWTPAASGPNSGVIFRVLNDYNYWFAGYGHQSTKLALFKYVSGSAVLVAYIDPGAVQGRSHHIEVRLSGTNVEVWWDGVLRLQTSDAYAQTATRHGLMWGGCADSTSTFDNFAVQLPSVAPSHHVTITPATATLPPGGLQTFSAQAFDASNAVIPETLFHWTISTSANGQIRSTSFFATSATLYGVTGSETVIATPVAGAAGTASVTVDPSTTLIFDTFTGGNGVALPVHLPDINVVSSGWTTHTTGDIGIYNGRAHSTQQDAPYMPISLIEGSTSDGVIAADWTPAADLPYGPVGGVIFRARDPYNTWFAGFGLYQSGLTLCKFVSGSGCQIVATTEVGSPVGATHHLEVRLAGAGIQVWWDGLLQLQASDSYNQSATRHGLMWGASADWLSTFDNFSVRGPVYSNASTVVVTPPNPTVTLGGLQIVAAQAYDSQNQLIPNALFHWTINDPSGAVLATSNYFSSSASVRAVAQNVVVSATLAYGGPSGSTSLAVDSTHTLIYDTFTGANDTPITGHTPNVNPGGGSWHGPSGQPVPKLQGGDLLPTQSASTWEAQTTIETLATDSRVAADWTPATGMPHGPIGGLVFRSKDANNYWFAGYGFMSYPLALWQVVNGNWSVVAWASVGNPLGTTHHIEVVTHGLTIEVWWDGVKQIERASAFAADGTQVGFRWFPNNDWQSTFDTLSVTGSTRCVLAPSAATVAFAESAASNAVAVVAGTGCQWTAETDVTWITFPSATAGTGNGNVAYAVAANLTETWRVGHIVVGGRVVTLTQQPAAPPPCALGLWPGSGQWAGDGGSGAFDISTSEPCGWSASTGASWIHVSTAGGTGSGTVSFEVDPNTTVGSRTGTIAVGGWPSTALYTITQNPAGTTGGGGSNASGACVTGVNPFYVLFGSGGATRAVNVAAPAGCVATATSSETWLSLSSSQGTGNWTTSITAQANTTGSTRTAVVQVGDATITVEQNRAADDSAFGPVLGDTSTQYSQATFAWGQSSDGRVRGYSSSTDSEVVIIIIPTAPGVVVGGGGSGNPGCESVAFAIPGRVNPMRSGCMGGEGGGESGGPTEETQDLRSGNNYSKVDASVIRRHEYFHKDFYVPDDNNSACNTGSGVTIASGFDLGQYNISQIQNFGFPTYISVQFTNFVGEKGDCARNLLAAYSPPDLSVLDARLVDDIVFDNKFNRVGGNFTNESMVGSFADLPWQAQTAIADMGYQRSLANTSFWTQITTGDWWAAYNNLNWFFPALPYDHGLNNRARDDGRILLQAINVPPGQPGALPWPP